MPKPSTEIWARLRAHTIGPHDVALSFTQRLAQDNAWSNDFATRVLEEYKRFCYLACTCGHPVTPSDQVDQAWHLHLTYTRDYWDVYCPQVLGRALHHGPTLGGASEARKYRDCYAKTLQAYRAQFGDPPHDIWPAPALRSGQRYQRRLVPEPTRHKTASRLAVGIVTLGLAGAAWAASDSAQKMIWFLLAIAALIGLMFWLARRNKRKRKDQNSGCGSGGGSCGSGCGTGRSGRSNDNDGGGESGCGGGCGGGD